MKPLIVLLIGLPGSGKTSVANEAAKSLQAIVLTTEAIHAQMVSKASIIEDRDFTPSEMDLIYKVTSILTHYLILAGKNVIVDGVFRSKQQRETIRNIASDLGVGFLPIHVTCSETAI
jgi:predicted kinase